PQGQSTDDGQLGDESTTSNPNQEVTNDMGIDPAMTPDVEAEVSETTPVTQNANRESMITASTPVSDTSAVADTATTTDPVNLNERGADAKLANAVSQALKGLREGAGPSRISVTLNPEHLGTVQVEIAVRDGSVDIVVSTPSEAARAAVTTLISDIRDMAGETGVGIGGFELSDGRGGTRQPDEGNSDDGTTPHRGQPRSATENADQHRHTIGGNGRVDLHL
ncbi:MAG: flagellar hook-length control protein FliK, partial [Ilumatobacteraceae bacterium]